jgi:hypothetical protein
MQSSYHPQQTSVKAGGLQPAANFTNLREKERFTKAPIASAHFIVE